MTRDSAAAAWKTPPPLHLRYFHGRVRYDTGDNLVRTDIGIRTILPVQYTLADMSILVAAIGFKILKKQTAESGAQQQAQLPTSNNGA